MILRYASMPMRQLAWVCLLVLATLIFPADVRSRRSYDPMWPKKAALYSDLIVRGETISVEDATVPWDNNLPPTGREGKFGVTLIGVKIREIIKGTYPDAEIRAVLYGNHRFDNLRNTYDYRLGEEVIFCLRYDACVMGGVYILGGDQFSIVKRGKVWMPRDGSDKGNIPKEIAYYVRLTEPRQMASDADAVVMGSIEAVDPRREFDCGFDFMCKADYAIVRVTTAWKGASAGEEILVRALWIGAANLDWYAPVPPLAVGQTYLMFLKRDDVGFYPFIGFNGFLEVNGERLLANQYVQYPLSTSKMLREIDKAIK